MIAEVLIAVGTATSAVAASRVVQALSNTVRHRVTKGESDSASQIRIVLADRSQDTESVVGKVIHALEGTRNAVVISGDLAVVKESGRGEPHIVVKHLSPVQREEIDNHDAPINDAAAFQTWLDSSSPGGSSQAPS